MEEQNIFILTNLPRFVLSAALLGMSICCTVYQDRPVQVSLLEDNSANFLVQDEYVYYLSYEYYYRVAGTSSPAVKAIFGGAQPTLRKV